MPDDENADLHVQFSGVNVESTDTEEEDGTVTTTVTETPV